MLSRDQLKRAASLTEEDFVELGKCRRPHNRLGFAYQVAFVRLFDRFPQQQPFELIEELVCFSAVVADNYAPFYSLPIECTDRDAAFVLDGLLYNESELEIEEYYTDTHGYTELNFAAFAMLGRRFCPRIKGVKHQHIYRIDATM